MQDIQASLVGTDHVAKKQIVSMASPYSEYFQLAHSLATEAGAIIKAAFYSEKQGLVFKDTVDLVTATDKNVEELVMSKIRECYPDHSFIAEEVDYH